MIKLNLILVIILSFAISCLHAQYPDTIFIKTKKIKGFGPFPHIGIPLRIINKDDTFIHTMPEYKGIQNDLESMTFRVLFTDFMQHSYQNYYHGKISEKRFNELKEGWNWNPRESEYSKEFIKLHVGILTSKDSNGTTKIILDKNNNYDFSDEEYFLIPPYNSEQKFDDYFNNISPVEVKYELFDGEKKEARTWLQISQFPSASDKNLLIYAFAEHHRGEFFVDGKKYNIAIKSIRTTFRDRFSAKVWNEETKESLSNEDNGIDFNGHVKLGMHFYRIGKASVNGSQIELIKDINVKKKGGSEVGMKAINFNSESITGEKIELKKLEGNIVLLDFWGTWCSPCREETPKLKSIYEKYKNKKFKIIGIANDNVEALNKYIEENRVEWSQIVQENDKSIINDYNIVGYPTTFLIDIDGKILAKSLRAEELLVKLDEIFGRK